MTPYSDTDLERDLHAALHAGDADRITTLAQLVDERDQPKPAATLPAAALWYAEQGFHIFRLSPGTKIPLKGSRGLHDATDDADQVRAWWDAEPEANIGLATGHLVDVIDIDGVRGVESWARYADDLPPILGRVSTPRPGGNHLYVAAVPGRGNKAGLLPSVDYRGTSGYVVAPPSALSGDNGKDTPGTYRWDRPVDLAALRSEAAA